MDTQRFDSWAKRLALGLSRRRLIGGLAAVTVAGAVPRGAATAPRRLPPRDCLAACCGWNPYTNPCCHLCTGDLVAPTMAFAGIAGAGTIRTEGGAAHFALFASRLTDIPDLPPDAAVPLARVQWRDPEADLTLESTTTAFYGPLEGVEGGRRVLGKMRVNGEEEYLFVLRAVAAAPVGGGEETVSLRVGDAVNEDPTADFEVPPTGFGYTAEGELVAGDLQLLDVDLFQQVIQLPVSS